MSELRDRFKELRIKYERSRADYESDSGYSETETRTEFIDQFLKALGWDVDNTSKKLWGRREVIQERSQPREDSFAKKPDYTLMCDGVRKLHIEAKKPHVDINKDPAPAFQARRYGYSDSANHAIVVLTNYRQTAVYDATVAVQEQADDALTARKYYWTFDQYEDKADEIERILGKTYVTSPDWDASVRSPEATQHLTADANFVRWLNDCRIRLAQDMIDLGNCPDITIVNDSVQQLLNRLIFVRMCEDRGIEGRNTLQATSIRKDASLLDLFKRLDYRYNTGLFATPSAAPDPVLCVRRETLNDIIDHLYSPSSPYSFAVLDCDFFGLVYEACLVERLAIDDGGRACLIRKREYEHRDIVTTPQVVVDFTVQQAIANVDENIDFPVTLDFATGSGRFAVNAYRKCLERYARKTGEWPVPFCRKKQLLTDHIFGIDIDYNAVEITKYSLLIALLDDESKETLPKGQKILPDLSSNIIHGNTLVTDVINDGDVNAVIPLDWGAAGLPDSFDLIVGNPPYMTTENMHRYDRWEFDYYKSHYRTAFHQFDKYFTFIERGGNKLSQRGVLGVVVPNKWINNVSGAQLRKYLTDGIKIRLLCNFRDHVIFPDQQIYVCILIAQQNSLPDIATEYEEPSSLAELSICKRLTLNQDDMPMNPSKAWVLPANDKERSILMALHRDSIPLSEVVEAKNGVQTSSNKVFILKKCVMNTDTCTFAKNKKWTIELGATRPYLDDSKCIRSAHSLRADARIIFPYDVDSVSGEYKLISYDDMRRRYPKTLEYLLSNSDTLRKRDKTAQKLMAGGEIYTYGRSQAIGYCERAPKIFYSVNQTGDKYALDESGMVYQSGGTAGEVALFPRKEVRYSMDFILALLDQPEIEMFLRKRGSSFRGAYYSRGTDVIKDVPVPKINFEDPISLQCHSDITKSFTDLRHLNDEIEIAPARMQAALNFRARKLRDAIRQSFLKIWKLDS